MQSPVFIYSLLLIQLTLAFVNGGQSEPVCMINFIPRMLGTIQKDSFDTQHKTSFPLDLNVSHSLLQCLVQGGCIFSQP